MTPAEWEDRFERWAKPPGQTEAERIENAITAVRKALDRDEFLSKFAKVFLQGSYRNRVNVRQDSDVDIGVLYTGNTFYAEYPPETTREDFGNIAGDYDHASFRKAVGAALVRHFGQDGVHAGEKAFDIHANTYRIDADVVPVFVHRRYGEDGSYICGTQLNPTTGGKIINWPERLYDSPEWPSQHYENGVAKNDATTRTYKGVVRILKTLRNYMESEGIAAAKPIKGFLIECLVWNVPDPRLDGLTWDENVQDALAFLWNSTKAIDDCIEWGEVSEWKYLFKGSPASKLTEAHAFLDAAWDYVGVR